MGGVYTRGGRALVVGADLVLQGGLAGRRFGLSIYLVLKIDLHLLKQSFPAVSGVESLGEYQTIIIIRINYYYKDIESIDIPLSENALLV